MKNCETTKSNVSHKLRLKLYQKAMRKKQETTNDQFVWTLYDYQINHNYSLLLLICLKQVWFKMAIHGLIYLAFYIERGIVYLITY